MRRREPARVLGPYQEGATFRIIHLDGVGHRRSHRLNNEKDAQQLKRKLERRIEAEPRVSIGNLIDQYLRYLNEVRAVRPSSLLAVRSSLHRFFGDARSRSPVFTKEAAEAWYHTHTQKPSLRGDKVLSVATHQLDLKVARRLYRWACKKELLRENPWQGIEAIGRARAGKPQLRVDEARRFVEGALADLSCGELEVLAPLMALLMGLRASEVMGRSSRDVDDEGRLIWIDSGKTDSSRRHLRVPMVLAPHLARLAAFQKDAPYLFGSAPKGGPPAYRLANIVQRLCRRYGVPQVCPHSLRGLYATLAMEQGAVADMVAASLGHTSFTTTAKHYAQPQAVRHAKTTRVLAVLERPELPPTAQIADLVATEARPLAAALLSQVEPSARPLESPVIAWVNSLSKRKPARVFGPYKERIGYRLIVVDGSQRKALLAPTKEKAEALRGEIVAVINHSQNLPRPEET